MMDQEILAAIVAVASAIAGLVGVIVNRRKGK